MTRYEFFVRAMLGGLGVGLGLICTLFIFIMIVSIASLFTRKGNGKIS